MFGGILDTGLILQGNRFEPFKFGISLGEKMGLVETINIYV